MSAILFKSCPRCVGDLCLEHDGEVSYLTCLCCGYVRYVDQEVEPLTPFSESDGAVPEPGT